MIKVVLARPRQFPGKEKKKKSKHQNLLKLPLNTSYKFWDSGSAYAMFLGKMNTSLAKRNREVQKRLI